MSGLPSPRRTLRGRSAGSFPKQRLVIEPNKDADCENLMDYANTLKAMIHAYIIRRCGLKIKAAILEKNEIEADS